MKHSVKGDSGRIAGKWEISRLPPPLPSSVLTNDLSVSFPLTYEDWKGGGGRAADGNLASSSAGRQLLASGARARGQIHEMNRSSVRVASGGGCAASARTRTELAVRAYDKCGLPACPRAVRLSGLHPPFCLSVCPPPSPCNLRPSSFSPADQCPSRRSRLGALARVRAPEICFQRQMRFRFQIHRFPLLWF